METATTAVPQAASPQPAVPPPPPGIVNAAPPAAPAAPPAPATTQPEGSYGLGGFLKSLDWVEIGLCIIAAASMFTVIYYYRKRSRQDEKNIAVLSEATQRHEKEINFIAGSVGLKKRRAA